MERIGNENRRRLDDRGHDYTGNNEWFVIARRYKDGSWYGETIESVRANVGKGDIAHRSHVMLGQLKAASISEQGMIAEMRMTYARRLLERKVCKWDEARSRAAEVAFKIVETLGKES
jgi:hypothetical protein